MRLYLGPYGGPTGGAVSYERGTPVGGSQPVVSRLSRLRLATCGSELVGEVFEGGRVRLVHLLLQVVDVPRLFRNRRPVLKKARRVFTKSKAKS